ncbi:MAG: Omp28-related outer membrane protein [Bacteroidales bacterium]|nr:Omp28-related outer membrane protein [Bacteroidales bacterium]
MKSLHRTTYYIWALLLAFAGGCLTGCVGIHDELDAGIVLVSQQTTVNILADESFSFRVLSGKEDITDRSRIYEVTDSGNILLEAAEYKPDHEGAFTFLAECEGHISPLLYLSANAVAPEGDRFLRKSLVLDFTATWCVNCPAMAQAISGAAALSGGRIEKIAVYYLDDLQVPAGSALARRFGVQALPHVVSGLDPALATSVASPDVIYSHNKSVLEQSTPAWGMAISSTLSGAELNVSIEVTSASDGAFTLGVALVEDGIVASQTGASDDYVHNCVLRFLLHGTAPADGLGDALGLMSEGDKKTVTLKATIAGNPSATRIVAYLMDAAGGLNNVASCMAGESLPYAYEK